MGTYGQRRAAGSLEDLAAEQDGVVSRGQLLALGVDRHAMRNQVQARRWRRVGSTVVALHHGPISERQRLWAAVLDAGAAAALAGITAATLGGLDGFRSHTIHVVIPYGSHPTRLAGVKVHVSRRFDARKDVHPTRLPPCTPLARSVVDAATWSDSDVRACGIMAAAVQQRLVTTTLLREELATAGAVRHGRLLVQVLGDIAGGSQSFAEIDAHRLFRRGGLPPPQRQAVRHDAEGRRRYLDLFWPQQRLCVEIDGAFHRDEREWRLDLDRQNDLVAEGIRVVRIPAMLLRADPAKAVSQVARILKQTC